ncbi:hypothetical protein EDD17DRAFT_1660775, partial [Pisolithus thermaeus]
TVSHLSSTRIYAFFSLKGFLSAQSLFFFTLERVLSYSGTYECRRHRFPGLKVKHTPMHMEITSWRTQKKPVYR